MAKSVISKCILISILAYYMIFEIINFENMSKACLDRTYLYLSGTKQGIFNNFLLNSNAFILFWIFTTFSSAISSVFPR